MLEFNSPMDVENMEVINKIAKRTLSKDEVFTFSGSSAGDMLIPGRHTKLSKELLQVMVDDAKRGVSFMLNHNWSSGGIQGIPYGKVFDGRLEESTKEGQTVEMHLDKFIFRDDEMVDGVSSNALIKRIETGILSDTSIGFGTDRMTCSICGMNYWGGDCSHFRGATYTMEDGSKKTCFITAMPPSVILPYNNNALFEESIVWDGAYPGAMVTQSKHGDIIETHSGKFSILEDKEELSPNSVILGQYHNGNLVTMVKKSDHKKVFKSAYIENENLKGSENQMNEKVLEVLKSLGIEYKEDDKIEDILNQIGERFEPALEESLKVVREEFENKPTLCESDIVFSEKDLEEKFGKKLSSKEFERLAKEGQEYHKALSSEAIAMGVRAMGNDFPSETWKKSFEVMGTSNIKDIMKTWELQANADIPSGRKTNPENNGKLKNFIPDEAFKVGK